MVCVSSGLFSQCPNSWDGKEAPEQVMNLSSSRNSLLSAVVCCLFSLVAVGPKNQSKYGINERTAGGT